MRYNTLVDYPMSVRYRTWVPNLNLSNRLTYRQYGDVLSVKCNIIVSTIGAVSLFSDEKLQSFALIESLYDAEGTPFMDDTWYTVQKVTPAFDASGHVSSYRHQLAVLAPELLDQPIDPPVQYPDLDQQS